MIRIFRLQTGSAKAAVGLVLLVSALLFSCSSQKTDSKPNILFIFSDDHAYQAISAYGGRLAKLAPTPQIDRIASEGMLFTRCYVTNSICAPSRATVLTGKHSHLNGVKTNRDVFDGGQQTFPKLLHQNGYQTAIFGKWHLKSDPVGFDIWKVLPGQGHYYSPEIRSESGTTVREHAYVTNVITDMAISWLEEGWDRTKPFLLMLQHKAPHREWEPATEFLSLFHDARFPEPANLFDDYQGRGTAARTQDMTIAKTMRLGADLKIWLDKSGEAYQRTYGRMDAQQKAAWDAAYDPLIEDYISAGRQGDDLIRWKYQRYMQDYLATIRSVDVSTGRVLDYLDQQGLTQNTIVIYNSDQGFYLGEHGWFDKRFMYEESAKTPLIVRWPGHVPAGRINAELTSNLDIAPTLLDAAGVEIPDDMQGISLLPLFADDSPDGWRNSLYYHYYEYPAVHMVHRHEGAVTKRYKLIHFYDLGEWELYDLQKDPTEMKSVYADPAYAEAAKEMSAELERLRHLYRVPPLSQDGMAESSAVPRKKGGK